MFAGYLSHHKDGVVPRGLVESLASTLSRRASDPRRIVEGPGHALVHVDAGMRPEPSRVDDEADGRTTVMVGAALFPAQALTSARAESDVARLHGIASRGELSRLADATGTFAAVHVDASRRRVLLIGDSLGLRPLYYRVLDGLVVFATQLRSFASMPGLCPSNDLASLWQLASLTYTTGGTTPFEGVRCVRAGEVIEIDATGVRSRRYLDWNTIPQIDEDEGTFLDRLHASFVAAVERRLGTQRNAFAFLSGGLDSRCVVATLRAQGVDVTTMNFAPEGSADLELGRLAAERFGTHHVQARVQPFDFLDRTAVIHAHAVDTIPDARIPERPRVVWTGYGGDPVLGPTNLDETIVELLGAGKLEAGVDAFLRIEGVGEPGVLFERGVRRSLSRAMREALLAELRAGPDPVRCLHSMIVSENMRWLLARHHEDIDLRRLEFEFPFLDADFLRVARSRPVAGFLRHRLYHRWLTRFPPETTAVPWQTYPGHERCPLPIPAGLRLQWPDWFSREEERALVRQALEDATRDFGDPRIRKLPIRRPVVALAWMLVAMGFHRYTYLLGMTRALVRHAC